MTQPYPLGNLGQVDEAALSEIGWVQDVVSGLRNIRGEMNIDPHRRIPVLMQDGDATAQAYLKRYRYLLIELGRLESFEEIAADSDLPESATVLLGGTKLLVPLGSTIDRAAELKRLDRELERLRNDLEYSEKKLANNSFVTKAPPDVVKKEEGRVTYIRHSIIELEKQRQNVEKL